MKTIYTIAILLAGVAIGALIQPTQAHPPCDAPPVTDQNPYKNCGYKTFVDENGNSRQIYSCD